MGGGAQNELLCRWTANAAGRPVLAGPVEAAAIGNLVVQAIALGELASIAEARELIRGSFEPVVYEPEGAAVPLRPYAPRVATATDLEVCCDFLGHVRGGRGASDDEEDDSGRRRSRQQGQPPATQPADEPAPVRQRLVDEREHEHARAEDEHAADPRAPLGVAPHRPGEDGGDCRGQRKDPDPQGEAPGGHAAAV